MAKLDNEDLEKLSKAFQSVAKDCVQFELKNLDDLVRHRVREFIREELLSEIRDAIREAVRSRVEVEVRVKE